MNLRPPLPFLTMPEMRKSWCSTLDRVAHLVALVRAREVVIHNNVIRTLKRRPRQKYEGLECIEALEIDAVDVFQVCCRQSAEC